MIDGGSFESRIKVGVRSRVLTCVIGERLVKTCSIQPAFTPRQGVYKVLNFSDAILMKSLDYLDQFLLLHGRKTGDWCQACDLRFSDVVALDFFFDKLLFCGAIPPLANSLTTVGLKI